MNGGGRGEGEGQGEGEGKEEGGIDTCTDNNTFLIVWIFSTGCAHHLICLEDLQKSWKKN